MDWDLGFGAEGFKCAFWASTLGRVWVELQLRAANSDMFFHCDMFVDSLSLVGIAAEGGSCENALLFPKGPRTQIIGL